jgi:hypothetical protein
LTDQVLPACLATTKSYRDPSVDPTYFSTEF